MNAGETNEFKVNVQRLRGFTNALSVAVQNLPPGVKAAEVAVSEKGGETTVKLIAETQASAFSGPLRFVVKDSITGVEIPAGFMLTTRTENNGVPGGYQMLVREKVEDLWLTVKPRKP